MTEMKEENENLQENMQVEKEENQTESEKAVESEKEEESKKSEPAVEAEKVEEPISSEEVKEEVKGKKKPAKKEGSKSEISKSKEEAESPKSEMENSSGDEHNEDYEFSEDDHEDEEYEKLSIEELIERIQLITGKDVHDINEKTVEAIKEAFFHIINHEREEARTNFLKEEGNAKEDFEYTKDKELVQKFKTYYDGYRDKKRKFQGDFTKLKDDNLAKKYDILERLRQFVDEEEDNVSVKILKDLEDEWKAAEPIPNTYSRELWANFNALRDRFYDKRSIFFELKDLDRKKNQTLKEELIEKAKSLLKLEPVNAAVAELKKLHEEYKHIGSVSNEIRPVLWAEFRKISDQIHERKQIVSAEFKKKLEENLEQKKVLIKDLETFYEYSSEKISEWNDKSRDIMNLQQEWKKIGPVPRELSKEISKTFWNHFKGFYKNKQQFFKSLDEKREKNYQIKEGLCEEVEKLLEDGKDEHQNVERVKQIQREWKNTGPAPRKKSEAIYKRFKDSCDKFFDAKRGHQKELEKDYVVNLEKKNALVEKIKSIKEFTEDKISDVEAHIEEWVNIGFVPKKAINSSKNAIQESVDALLKKAKDISDDKLEMIKTKMNALLMKADLHGSKNIQGEIEKVRRQISKINDETNTLKTNMEFFANTKNAEKLKDEVQVKIDRAEAQMVGLKNKIKLLRQIDN